MNMYDLTHKISDLATVIANEKDSSKRYELLKQYKVLVQTLIVKQVGAQTRIKYMKKGMK